MEAQFGNRFKYLRKRSKLTQKSVAEELHITRQSISKWEQNISLPPITLIVPISKVLGCTLNELFYDCDEN